METRTMAYSGALSALADPTRQRIVEELRAGGKPVGEIAASLPVSRPAVSQHLKVLKDAGLVRETRAGTRHIYNVEPKGLVELRRYLDRLWSDALHAFEAEAAKGAAKTRKGRRAGGRR
jgi:DNA-binding transcriptional ArsR family regulator